MSEAYPSKAAMAGAVELEIQSALGRVQTIEIGRQIQKAIDASTGWQPIETAPKVGRFLVYLPEEEVRPFQVMYRNERGVTVIGGAFGFDMSKPTLWMPIPPIQQAKSEVGT